ncbi:MAG: hypothetical protein VZR00_07100 [Lachnospiraceae bacterium]|nr:hypothetical protein [Lachnospiraceae bacterium]MEE3461639.1 hypothetical protein [Lachnospiraceae bacterium]
MHFRYKKIILISTMFIMLIGITTFSMIKPFYTGKTHDKKVHDTENATGTAISPDADLAGVDGLSSDQIRSDITTLISNYYDAKQKEDMDALSLLVNDASYLDENKLDSDAKYVEQYRDVSCTIYELKEKGEYRVYARYYVKAFNVNTLMPTLSALLVKEEDGRFKIVLGTISDNEIKEIDALDESAPVKALSAEVQNELQKCINEDPDVKDFYEMLTEDS